MKSWHKKSRKICGFYCAQERTRTFTTMRSLVPETSASTNSATWAIFNELLKLSIQKNKIDNFQCPGQESNLHSLAGTWPSTMRVYHFRHLGNRGVCVWCGCVNDNFGLQRYKSFYNKKFYLIKFI